MNMIFVQQNIIVVRCNVFNKKKESLFFFVFLLLLLEEKGRELIKEVKRWLINMKWPVVRAVLGRESFEDDYCFLLVKRILVMMMMMTG